MSTKYTRHSTRLNNWQEVGILLGGVLVDSTRLINQALPKMKDAKLRKEIERFCCRSKNGPYPSEAAIESLKKVLYSNRKPMPK